MEQLSSDVRVCSNLNDLIPITIYSRVEATQTTHNSNNHLRFLFYQLFFQYYCTNSSSILNQKKFIELIEDYYSSNRKELRLVHQFDDEYNSSKRSLSWLVRDCFIRRVLTQSLLTLNIQILFSLRFFIKDMTEVMVERTSTSNQRYNSYSSRTSTKEQIFYRGQALAKETLEKIKLNIGKEKIHQ